MTPELELRLQKKCAMIGRFYDGKDDSGTDPADEFAIRLGLCFHRADTLAVAKAAQLSDILERNAAATTEHVLQLQQLTIASVLLFEEYFMV